VDGAHDGRPADPQGRRRPRRPHGRRCRPAGRPRRGPVRSAPPEDRSPPPARSRCGPRRPAPDSARSACARPAPLGGRRSAGRAHPDRAAAVEFGPDPATHATHHGGRRLDGEPPLATRYLCDGDLEAVQAEQPGGRGTRVLTPWGLLSCRRQTSASYARPQVPFGSLRRRQQHTASRFMTKSRFANTTGALPLLSAWRTSCRSSRRPTSSFCLSPVANPD
jgi:hypothetical protein